MSQGGPIVAQCRRHAVCRVSLRSVARGSAPESGYLIFLTFFVWHRFCFCEQGRSNVAPKTMSAFRTVFLPHALWLCLCSPALAAPISANPGTQTTDLAAPARPRLSATELVLSDPGLSMAPDPVVLTPLGNSRLGVLPQPGYRIQGAPGEWDGMGAVEPGGGLSLRDSLRSYVNVLRGSEPGQDSGAERRRGPQGEPLGLAGVDLGPAANEWIQETVQDILISALRLDVNQRGQTTFSVLGLGEFSVNLSPDRTEVAIASGDTVLATAQRTPGPRPGGNGYGGNSDGDGWYPGGMSITAGSSLPGESPLRQALELALDLASHPLSFLVYGVILAYALLWSVLSRRARRQRIPRSLYTAASSTSRQPHMSARTGRTRRKRRHRARPSTQQP